MDNDTLESKGIQEVGVDMEEEVGEILEVEVEDLESLDWME